MEDVRYRVEQNLYQEAARRSAPGDDRPGEDHRFPVFSCRAVQDRLWMASEGNKHARLKAFVYSYLIWRSFDRRKERGFKIISEVIRSSRHSNGSGGAQWLHYAAVFRRQAMTQKILARAPSASCCLADFFYCLTDFSSHRSKILLKAARRFVRRSLIYKIRIIKNPAGFLFDITLYLFSFSFDLIFVRHLLFSFPRPDANM